MSNEVIDCLLNHRSVRRFKPDPIEQEKMALILKAGTRAATAGNLQFYTFIVIDDDEKKKELDRAWTPQAIRISKSPVVVVALADQYRVKRWLTLHTEREIHNDTSIYLFLALWDALIALQNVVVAAESLGIGTCYIGSILQMNLQKILNVPEHVFPAGLVCMGYPEHVPDLNVRLPMEAVVHHNSYHLPTDDEINEWYQERDAVWEKVSDKRKADLAKEDIFGIAQALAVQRYSKEVSHGRSKGVLENIVRSGFNLDTGS